MPRAGRVGLIVLVASLAAPHAAFGAGWSAPVELTPSAGLEPRVAIQPDGGGLVAWGYREAGTVSYATRAPGGGFGAAAPVDAVAGEFLVDLASNARGDASMTWRTGPEPPRTAFRPAGGPLGNPVAPPLAGVFAPSGSGPTAVDGAGNTTFAGSLNESTAGTVTRMAGGDFGPVRSLPPPRGTPVVAADGTGNLVYAWKEEAQNGQLSRVYLATAAPGGEVGPARAIGEPIGPYEIGSWPKVRVVANERGDVAVAWVSVPPTTPATVTLRDDTSIVLAVRPAGGEFGSAEPVKQDPTQRIPAYRWDLAISPRGDVGVAWSELDGVAAAFRPADGALRPAERVDDSGRDPALAFDGDGNALLAYAHQIAQHHHRILARRRSAGGDYAAAQLLDDAPHLYVPDIAVNKAGEAIVAWTRQDRTSRDSKEDGVLAAVYDPSFPVLTSAEPKPSAGDGAISFKASTAAPVVARFERRAGKSWKALGKAKLKAKRGRNTIRPSGDLAERLSRPGTYRATLTATLAKRLATPPRRVKFKVR